MKHVDSTCGVHEGREGAVHIWMLASLLFAARATFVTCVRWRASVVGIALGYWYAREHKQRMRD